MLNSLIKKYLGLSIVVKASLWFTVCNILQKGISMLTVPIFTRMMSIEEYGVYSVFQSWYNILIIVVTLNLFAGVLNKGMVKYENDRWGFLSAIQTLSTLTTGIFFLSFIAFPEIWCSLLGMRKEIILILFFQFFFAPSFMYWSAKQRYEYNYKSLVIVTILMSALGPILGIFSVYTMRDRTFGLVFSFGIVQICFGLIFYIYICGRGKKFYVREYWKYALAFNLPLIPHYLSQMLLIQSDRIMIDKLVGNGLAAIYSVAYNVSLIMSLVTNSLVATYIPSLYSDLKNKNVRDIQDRSFTLNVIVAVLTIAAMLFGPEFIKIFATEEYYQAIWIIPPVAMSVFFNSIYSVFVNIEFYYEKTKYVMYVTVILAGLNIILNYIGIKTFGYIAAGYTTFLCYLLFCVGHYFVYKKMLKSMGVVDEYVKIIDTVKLVVGMVVVMTGCLLVYNVTVLRYLLIIIIASVCIWKRKKLLSYNRKLKI